MSGRCVIISGGDYSDCYIPGKEDFVIACDKGLEWAGKMGVVPNLLIGDFDSYTGKRPENMETIVLPHEKDDTDTHFAIKEALNRGYKDIILICAWGGRFDHAFSNLQTCRFASEKGARVSIIDNSVRICFITGGLFDGISLERDDSMAVSVFSLSDVCEGVEIKGTQYELENAVLYANFPIGTSNEWDKEEASFKIKKGTMMIVLSKMK